MTFKSINKLGLPYFTIANITNFFLMSAKDFKVLTPSIHFSLYCVDAQLNELDVIHIIGVKNYFIRLILEFHVCSFDVHAMYALEVFNFQQWNYVHATAVWTTSCRVSTQYRLKWNPLNASTDLVIIYIVRNSSELIILLSTLISIFLCDVIIITFGQGKRVFGS